MRLSLRLLNKSSLIEVFLCNPKCFDQNMPASIICQSTSASVSHCIFKLLPVTAFSKCSFSLAFKILMTPIPLSPNRFFCAHLSFYPLPMGTPQGFALGLHLFPLSILSVLLFLPIPMVSSVISMKVTVKHISYTYFIALTSLLNSTIAYWHLKRHKSKQNSLLLPPDEFIQLLDNF